MGGEMADMLLEQALDCDGDGFWEASPSRPRKVLKCRACRKPNLIWRKILDQWVMFESDTKLHTCGGYEPPIEVLKHLASEVLTETKNGLIWRLMDKAKKRGGLLKLLPILPDDQLIDLYTCFVSDNTMDSCKIDYEKEINLLRKELIKRMTK